jgi:hypothetical protein
MKGQVQISHVEFHFFTIVLIAEQILAGETEGSVEGARPIGLRTDGFYFQPNVTRDTQNIAVVSRLPVASEPKKVYFVVKQPTKIFRDA